MDTPAPTESLAPGKRAKRKPRGKPFPKVDNPIGVETRFKEGVSGNPSGRPKTPFSDAYREVAGKTMEELEIFPADPVPVAIAKRLAKDAIAGDVKSEQALVNRVEGTPRQTITGADGGPVAIIFDVPRPDRTCTKE